MYDFSARELSPRGAEVNMKINLNGEWRVGVDGTEYKINVPSALQSMAELGEKYPDEAMLNSFLGTARFKRQFYLEQKGKHCLITFMGIMPYGTVYINGNEVGRAQYCQTAFSFDIGRYANIGINTVEVLIEEKNLELIGGMRFDLLNWSGIFDGVYITVADTVIKEPEIIYDMEAERMKICAYISENGINSSLEITDCGKCVVKAEAVSKNKAVCFDIETSALEKWDTEKPKLYKARISAGTDFAEFNLGIRDFRCSGNRLLLNGIPFYAFGGGDEYFSPSISPLTDKEIIRRRYSKIKEMGFNFYRFHTHSPTRAELDVCDELGITVSIEIPILSNFSRITDTDKGIEILTEYIKQTRTHACIADYCLGNEGVQLLVKNKAEHETARRGYKTVKAFTEYQLAMMCFGYQGETPELDTDIMTPHLWSHEFRWAYQGLTKTPWSFIEGTLSDKPCIVHEFGKYGVFPSDSEDSYLLDGGYRMSNRKYNDEIFFGTGLENERQRIIDNSRKLSTLCARTAFEAMRRNSGISGYIYWTMFRMGIRAGGLCDDFGMKADLSPEVLKKSANAPLGIFADRDFSGRTFACGEQARFNITVSNFSKEKVKNAELTVTLKDGENCIAKNFESVGVDLGEISVKASADFIMPQCDEMKELSLEMKLSKDGSTLSENSMKLWCCPNRRINASDRIVYHLHNRETEKNLKSCINVCADLWSWISILTGCIIPEYGFMISDDKIMDYIDIAINKMKPDLVICDKADGVSEKLIKSGIPVLFIDTGSFPEEFYPDIIPGNSFFDLNRFYAPFRTSWDEGNSATLIDGKIFSECGDFADLRWYSAVEDSTGLLKKEVIRKIGFTETENSVRLIQRVKDKVKVTKNSTVYFEKTQKKRINECIYYLDGKIGKTKAAIASLNLFNDSFGKYIFEKIIKNLSEK